MGYCSGILAGGVLGHSALSPSRRPPLGVHHWVTGQARCLPLLLACLMDPVLPLPPERRRFAYSLPSWRRSRLVVSLLLASLPVSFVVGAAAALYVPRMGAPLPLVGVSPVLTEVSAATSRVASGVRSSVVYIRAIRPAVVSPVFDGVGSVEQRSLRPHYGPRVEREDDQGSGFIVSDSGLIVTNAHVISGATSIVVRLFDRREFLAKVVGVDTASDIALLRVKAVNLRPVEFGSSVGLQVGQSVLAIGNPFGEALSFSVTSGIVSATGRVLPPEAGVSGFDIQDFIQTDAVINPGSSGGPLVDMSGRVVGMNTALASSTGLYAGYGFAIPSDLMRPVLEALRVRGRLDRSSLGLSVTDGTDIDAAAFGLASPLGVTVQDVLAWSPLSSLLRPGDLVLSVDGRVVTRVAELQQATAFRTPREGVELRVLRQGRPDTLRLSVLVVRPPAHFQAVSLQPLVPSSPSEARRLWRGSVGARAIPSIGLDVYPTASSRVRQPVIPVGLWVREIDPSRHLRTLMGSLADWPTPPDIITSVNGEVVSDIPSFERALSHMAEGSVVTFEVATIHPFLSHRIVRFRF